MASKNFNSVMLFMLMSVLPVLAQAQAITVLGSGEDARTCSLAAETAAATLSSSMAVVDICTRALEHGSLNVTDQAGTYVNRGIILTALEHSQEALIDYNRAMKLMPKMPEPYVGRGNINFLGGSFELAVEDYNKALELNISRDHIVYFNRAMVYEKQGKIGAAEADYRHALQLQPGWSLPQEKLDRLSAPPQP